MGWACDLNPLEKNVDLSRYIFCHRTECKTAKATTLTRKVWQPWRWTMWKESCILLIMGIIYIHTNMHIQVWGLYLFQYNQKKSGASHLEKLVYTVLLHQNHYHKEEEWPHAEKGTESYFYLLIFKFHRQTFMGTVTCVYVFLLQHNSLSDLSPFSFSAHRKHTKNLVS